MPVMKPLKPVCG